MINLSLKNVMYMPYMILYAQRKSLAAKKHIRQDCRWWVNVNQELKLLLKCKKKKKSQVRGGGPVRSRGGVVGVGGCKLLIVKMHKKSGRGPVGRGVW